MQVTIETINGKQCTVIRRPFDAEWVREQLAMGVPIVVDLPYEYSECLYTLSGTHYCGDSGEILSFKTQRGRDIPVEIIVSVVTIFPALPRHPKPDDAKLLYRYMAEGLYPSCTIEEGECDDSVIKRHLNNDAWLCDDDHHHYTPWLTHCLTGSGERVEVAIND